MVKDAVDNLEGELTYGDIKKYINSKWNNVNQDTITAQIIVATVNHTSRIHYNENKKPRLSKAGSHFDLLFYLGRGKVIKYDAAKHGIWEIYKDESNNSNIRLVGIGTFLFAWNPNNWAFEELEEKIDELKSKGSAKIIWSISAHKKVKIGDRAFIVQVGTPKKGIFASGYVVSKPFLLPHWSGDKLVPRVTIELDILLNPKHSEILDIDYIKDNTSSFQQWTPQSSGIQIKMEIVDEVERLWFDFIKTKVFFSNNNQIERIFIEGTSYQLTQTVYERNRYARTLCLQYYGYSCAVCGFNFEETYGDIGNEFIHVHHLNQVQE